jgi:Uma2 family endonuclease
MRAPVETPLLTAEDVERLSIPDKRVELVRGRLIVREPPGTWHGSFQARLCYHLLAWVEPRALGMVTGEAGFKVEVSPDTVRGPDVAFISAARLPEVPQRGFPPFSPDLAVEILPPDDRPSETIEKIGQWLEGGTRLVWVIDPTRNEARVFRADGSLGIISRDGVLDGEDVIPGFRVELSEVLR